MSHERYPLEERTKNHWRNPEWEKLAGRENRYPSEPDYTQLPLPKTIPENQVFPLHTGEPALAADITYPIREGSGNFQVRVGKKTYLFIDNPPSHDK